MTDFLPTDNAPSVAVVIPAYGRPELLARTLESMTRAVWPSGFETVRVVENGPRGEIESVVRRYTELLPVRYQHEPTLGLSAARNAGLACCETDIVLFFDSDIRLENDSLLAYRRAFDECGINSFYGGPISPDYVRPPAEWLHAFLPPSARGFDLGEDDFWLARPSPDRLDKPLLIGGNMAFPRLPLLEVGGFDPVGASGDRGGVGEETRVQLRLFEAGYHGRYVAGARVWHYVPVENCSPEWALGRAYRHGLTDGLMARKSGRRSGVQRWMIRHAVELEARCLWARLRGQSLSERFSTEWKRARFRGLMAGCRDRGGGAGETISVDET